MENLNQRISKIIEYSELSPSEFADEVEVPRSSISHIASGRNKPSLDFLIKVKDKFPELQWDWLIKGEGEMKKSEEISETEGNSAPASLPDLFSIISDENFGKTESEDKIQNQIPRELPKTEPSTIQGNSNDSQELENRENKILNQTIENQSNKIKRIVMFFENGRFESFEP